MQNKDQIENIRIYIVLAPVTGNMMCFGNGEPNQK